MRFLLRKSPKAVRAVNCIVALFALGGIIYITVSRGSPEKQELFLMPFHSFIEAKEQKEMYRELLMNVLLFVPFGFSAPFALTRIKNGEWHSKARYVVITVVTAIMLSVAIEAVQYCYALGRCETDDVLCNTLGAALGACGYLLQGK